MAPDVLDILPHIKFSSHHVARYNVKRKNCSSWIIKALLIIADRSHDLNQCNDRTFSAVEKVMVHNLEVSRFRYVMCRMLDYSSSELSCYIDDVADMPTCAKVTAEKWMSTQILTRSTSPASSLSFETPKHEYFFLNLEAMI